VKIAIIGGGISGLLTAHLLSDGHEVTLFEANNRLGGHTDTHDVDADGKPYRVDTGFIVFNERTYPNFIKLLDRLGVASQPSVMSFSVSCKQTGLEYSATNLETLFSQHRNLLNLPFWGMLLDIFRFNNESEELLGHGDMSLTLGEYLKKKGYSKMFRDKFLIPMGSAIWSADPEQFQQFPAAAFAHFFSNHGLLNVIDQPRWRVVSGGSSSYLEPISRPFRDRIRLATPVRSVRRFPDHVELTLPDGSSESYDQVVMACHSDQALGMLSDPSDAESELLGAIPYQLNKTVLHTDTALMPGLKKAWSSWNYMIPKTDGDGVAVTYWMNRLQSLEAPVEFCVTLNSPEAIVEDKIIKKLVYHHPVYSAAAFSAQKRRSEISGINRTWYCGAYWGYGFHEDGVKSALTICEQFGKKL
jgi:uncharacterized protein